MLSAQIKRRMRNNQMHEKASNFIKELRDDMKIFEELQQMCLQLKPANIKLLDEFNHVKNFINDCVVESKGGKLLLLPILFSVLREMSVKERIQKITAEEEGLKKCGDE